MPRFWLIRFAQPRFARLLRRLYRAIRGRKPSRNPEMAAPRGNENLSTSLYGRAIADSHSQIHELVEQGMSTKEIATETGLSEYQVKDRIAYLKRKGWFNSTMPIL